MKKVLFVLTLFLSLASEAFAQKVTGIVTDNQKAPLMGVNVVNQKTKAGTITDVNGRYSLSASSGDVLLFSYIGMKEVKKTVKGGRIDVAMEEDATLLGEVVAIGYGTATKKDLTGAVASLKIENSPVLSMPNVNVLETLKGSLPGVNIGISNSAGETPSLSIRGQNSIAASTSPLLVVDGIIGGNFSELNPQDIATIDILKDASSAAVYGSRAANGVIIVTTKRGKTEKPLFNFNVNYGVQKWTRLPDMMNGEQYIKFKRDQAIANGVKGVDLETENLLLPKEYAAYKAGSEIDWFDAVTQYAPTGNYQFSVSGASEKLNYYISTNYVNQKGLIQGDAFDKVSFLAKLETKFNEYVKTGINVSGSVRDYSGNKADMYTATYIGPWGFKYSTAELYKDWLEVYPGGNTTWSNPLRGCYNVDNKEKYYAMSLKAFAEFRLPWIDGLSWRVNGNCDYDLAEVANFYHEKYYVNTLKETEMANPLQFLKDANGNSKDTKGRSWLINQILNYNKAFGAHRIDVTLMSERQRSHNYGLYAAGKNFEEAGTTVLGYNALELGAADQRGIDTWKSQSSQLAYMARANYVFKDRYHASASFRRDGYSAFGENHKYGNFKSFALAWTLSEEDFFKNNIVNYLKLRLSYGENGNPSIGSYATFPSIATGGYIFGTTYLKSLYQNSLANKVLGWEKTTSYNVGLDFGILKDRLTGNVEYYNSNTTDLLITRRLPSMTGYGSIKDNMGKVGNWGVEVGLHSQNIVSKDFQWDTDLSFWMNRNKIKSLYGLDSDKDGKEDDDKGNRWFIGKSLGAIYDYTFDGIVQEDEVEYQQKYNMKPGDVKFKDLDNNGKIDANDKSIIGYSKPNFNFNMRNTLSYKGFQLYFSIDWIAGGNGYYLSGNEKGLNPNRMPNANWLNKTYWTPETPSNSIPKANYNYQTYGYGFYQSRAFVRLQDVTLSYALNQKILSKIKVLNSAKLFISGKNLLTFTDWSGLDPESGQTIGEGSPSFKTYSFGFNVSF